MVNLLFLESKEIRLLGCRKDFLNRQFLKESKVIKLFETGNNILSKTAGLLRLNVWMKGIILNWCYVAIWS